MDESLNQQQQTPLPQPQPLVEQPPSPQPQVFTQVPVSTPVATPPQEKKSKLITVISVFFFIHTLLFVWFEAAILFTFTITNYALKLEGASDYPFLRSFPTYGLLPISIISIAFYFCFLMFKIKNGTKKSWWISIISLISITLLYPVLYHLLVSPVANFAEYPSSLTIAFINPNTPLAIITTILLIIAFKKFKSQQSSLSKKTLITLAVILIIFVLPIYAYFGYAYYKTTDTDLGYTQAQKQISFHIYRPTYIPNGGTQESKIIMNKKLGSFENAVRIAYSYPLNTGKQGIIMITQVGVTNNFDLVTEIEKNFSKNYESSQEISLSIAKDNKGIYKHSKIIDFVSFVTQDNNFILIAATTHPQQIPLNELIPLAESLK